MASKSSTPQSGGGGNGRGGCPGKGLQVLPWALEAGLPRAVGPAAHTPLRTLLKVPRPGPGSGSHLKGRPPGSRKAGGGQRGAERASLLSCRPHRSTCTPPTPSHSSVLTCPSTWAPLPPLLVTTAHGHPTSPDSLPLPPHHRLSSPPPPSSVSPTTAALLGWAATSSGF